jgi:hypothetical protein
MDAVFNEVQINSAQSEMTINVGQRSRSMQMLSPQEVSAVAGGPEVDVGNGVSPP